jgi:hypothetical protein
VGFIVNFSSQAGRRKSELGNLRYFAATAGILGFTRQLVRQSDHIVVYAEQIDQTARLELSEPRIFKRLSGLGGGLKIGDQLNSRTIVNFVRANSYCSIEQSFPKFGRSPGASFSSIQSFRWPCDQ